MSQKRIKNHQKPKKHTEKTTTQKQPKVSAGLPKYDRQGREREGSRMESFYKKKEYGKKQTYCGERVHAGSKHADCDRISTRPCGGPHTARGRILG